MSCLDTLLYIFLLSIENQNFTNINNCKRKIRLRLGQSSPGAWTLLPLPPPQDKALSELTFQETQQQD